jgi:hypothetical protein
MACPHFSRLDNDCALADDQPKDDEEVVEAPAEDLTNRAWCVGEGDGYRNCPVFQRFVAELLH